MRALKGGLQRICKDHRLSVAIRYREYCESFLERSGPLPKYAMSKLRELASIETIELPRLLAEEQAIRAKRLNPKLESDLRRISRLRRQLRSAARSLEQDLERLRQTPSPVVNRVPTMQELLDGVQR